MNKIKAFFAKVGNGVKKAAIAVKDFRFKNYHIVKRATIPMKKVVLIRAITIGRFVPSIKTHKRITIDATGVDLIIDIPMEIKLSSIGTYTDTKAKAHPSVIPRRSPIIIRVSESKTVFQNRAVNESLKNAFIVSGTLGSRKSYPIKMCISCQRRIHRATEKSVSSAL